MVSGKTILAKLYVRMFVSLPFFSISPQHLYISVHVFLSFSLFPPLTFLHPAVTQSYQVRKLLLK